MQRILDQGRDCERYNKDENAWWGRGSSAMLELDEAAPYKAQNRLFEVVNLYVWSSCLDFFERSN